jgi:hypothetical protein
VVCRCVWSRNLEHEEAKARKTNKNKQFVNFTFYLKATAYATTRLGLHNYVAVNMNIFQCLRYHTCVCVSVTDIVGSRSYSSGSHPSLVVCKGYRVVSRSLSFNIDTSSTDQKPHVTVDPRVVKLSAIYITRWCITVFTSLHWIRSWITLIQSTTLQIFEHPKLHPCFPSGLPPSSWFLCSSSFVHALNVLHALLI